MLPTQPVDTPCHSSKCQTATLGPCTWHPSQNLATPTQTEQEVHSVLSQGEACQETLVYGSAIKALPWLQDDSHNSSLTDATFLVGSHPYLAWVHTQSSNLIYL